ncbi:MAG: hypothetical protein HC895_25945 [Leptolyngbyaceae cyanobacterium SM1_3_5]|nr:hypothetical protein [Leptolyngbyaceae cyanobacterium SM1_3_5]
MPRKWLEAAIKNNYIPAIQELDDTPAGHQAATELNQRIRQQWHDRGSTALTQQQSLVDDTRKALKAALGEDHWALNYIGFSRDESIELNNIKQGRVSERNESVQQIEKPDEIVAKAVRLLDSPEWADMAAGLAVLTGRRAAEVLSTAQFEKKSHWSVIFTGALKRRGESVILSFEIPTLTNADRVIATLAKLRAALPEAIGLPPTEINQRYEPAMARACDREFADLVPAREGKDNLYTHLFRAVYATIATFWYCPPSVHETEFKAAIQGHYFILDEQNPDKRRSLAADRHYSDYEIADAEIAHYNGKRKGIKLGVSGIEPIETFKSAWEKNMKPKAPKARKIRSSYRIWQDDKERIDRILEQFEGIQQDKFCAFLDWFEGQEIQPNQAEATPIEPTSTNAPTADIPMQPQTASTQLDQPELDAVAPSSNDSAVIAPATGDKIDRLIDTMNRFVEMQMSLATAQFAQPAKLTRSKPVSASLNGSIAPSTDEKSLEAGQTAEPKKRTPRSSGGAAESVDRINQAISAVIAYNDVPDRKHDDKWAIGINTLKAFAGSQEAIVEIIGGKNRKREVVKGTRQDEIEAHYQKRGIKPDHNYRHRGKESIDQVIKNWLNQQDEIEFDNLKQWLNSQPDKTQTKPENESDNLQS